MNPIDLRILNAYRDVDMKAHRRLAKNTALIECCQVVVEKAGVNLQPASRAASSLRDGGGERARLPDRTATDRNGGVSGVDSGGYARKAGRSGSSAAAVNRPGISMPAAAATAAADTARKLPRWQSPPASGPASSSPSQSAPATAPERPRQGAMRFSSISGLRRR